MNTTSSSTIYALASASGKAGVAVVRISGTRVREVVPFLGIAELPAPRQATLATLTHQQKLMDKALCLWFPAPHSFTGEDVLELHLHGSRAVLKLLFEALGHCPGLRLAEPGEFARRAFLNGKFDLLEAEGLADLIDAETEAQHAQALRQLGGETSARLAALREAMLAPLALLEAYIDFPEEEIPPSVLAEVQARVEAVRVELADLLDDGGIGEKIRDGLEVVIFGPPNVGKSTLINTLARRELAIVSAEPGTTRDLIEAHLDIAGYAVTLVDTAGLHEASGAIEKEGIRRAEARAKKADLKLCLLEADAALQQYNEIKGLIDSNTLIIINKTDITQTIELSVKNYGISLKTGAGIEELISLLKEEIVRRTKNRPSPLVTRVRHRESLVSALATLQRFSSGQPLELACEELRLAAREIGKITGKIMVDDVLDLVFSRFCIGK